MSLPCFFSSVCFTQIQGLWNCQHTQLRNPLPRKIGMVLMLASFLNFTGSFCTITDFACFCILLCLLVQNNEWYTCSGVCKLINFMNVDVASFFIGGLGWGGDGFCLSVFNRKGITENGLVLAWPQLDWKPFVLPGPRMFHAVVDKWCHFSFQTGGVDALEHQGGGSDEI